MNWQDKIPQPTDEQYNRFLNNIMKVPYQIRIEPEQLEQLKKLAKENGTSVNHEIRQAIRKVVNCN